MLSAIEEDRIAAAVTKAEEATTGEIVVVLAREVSRYREVPLAWAAALSLAVPPLLFALGVRPIAARADDLWTLGQSTASTLGLTFSLYAIAQIVLFVIIYAVVSIPAARRALTPAVLRRHRVDTAAHHQFLSLSNRAAGSETGVLIFVALDDRQVRVLADAGIHQKCGEAPWQGAVGAVAAAMKAGHDPTGGILEAVGICGAALSQHYPGAGPHAFSARPLEV
jgi:putative membrane protein